MCVQVSARPVLCLGSQPPCRLSVRGHETGSRSGSLSAHSFESPERTIQKPCTARARVSNRAGLQDWAGKLARNAEHSRRRGAIATKPGSRNGLLAAGCTQWPIKPCLHSLGRASSKQRAGVPSSGAVTYGTLRQRVFPGEDPIFTRAPFKT